MRVAILESIVMPAGHEVEFDRILVEELKRQGHTPVFFVPKNFQFKFDYQVDVEYLDGGEVVTYAGANKFQKIFLSIKREYRRKQWFESAYQKVMEHKCDCLIIPTATYRYVRTILKTNLKKSPVPVHIVFHGINPREKSNFVRQAKSCENYANIFLKVITLRDDFKKDNLKNVYLIKPPVFKPVHIKQKKNKMYNKEIVMGFFGQYRREKNVRFFLDAFKEAKFNVPVKLIMQGATAREEDSREFDRIIKEYNGVTNIEFWHKSLLDAEWEKALMDVDIIVAPYAAERYRYHWSAMLFTAIGYYKPILQSPEMNPEVLEEFKVGEAVQLDNIQAFSIQLERFVNEFRHRSEEYKTGLVGANQKYSQSNLIRGIIDTIKT